MFSHLRIAGRGFAKHPGFAAIAVLILALGIGASTAVFSVVHALLLSPLRYDDARRLVQVQAVHPRQGVSTLAPATASDVRTQVHALTASASQTYYYVNLTGSGTPALVTGVQATADYFKVFNVAPLLGRTWNPDECRPGAAPVVVLGEQLWQTQYGGRRDLIGRTILMDDTPTTVIGIMPKTFNDPWGNGSLWMPMPLGGDTLTNRSQRYWSTFARLAPGATVASASAELAALGAQLERQFPDHYRDWTMQAADLQGLVVGDYREALLIILGAVGCVMLITCANLAGLCLVRAASRRKELAIRVALGATRAQLSAQLLTESLLLALAGGIGGVLLANWGLAGLLATVGDGWLPRSDEIALNTPVLLATLTLTLVNGLAFGLAPAVTATRIDAQDALKDAHSASGASAQRLRSALVVAEIALALVLLVGAGLLGRNLHRILNRDAGIEASRVLSLTLTPSEKRYDSAEKRADYYRRTLAEVAAVPGVQSAAYTQTSPFRWGIPITLQPVPREGVAPAGNLPQVFYDSVSRDYFKTMGTPLRAGRWFNDADVPGAKPVVVISESTARRFFGEENPVGRELTPDPTNAVRFEIVGVVGDIARTGLTSATPLQVYRALSQRPTAFATLMVRTSLPPATLAKSVQEALWRVDPDIPVSDVVPMDQVVRRTATQPRLYLTLFGVFAALALVLSGIGLYGLVAYSVAQRTREFGIRTALGANPGDVLRLVLREGGALVALGLAFGLAGALATARLLQQLLFRGSAYDPLIFATVVLLLGGVALAACVLPARRAARVDPLVALRND
ncbi:ABC transporter permease [Oleiharenicola sp. Vm1]|uniref:ABC transporter permease n=1 Tax=Oleiharenicola sp. Vm1 TaxID=3398393 RepID=UPI0039F562A6